LILFTFKKQHTWINIKQEKTMITLGRNKKKKEKKKGSLKAAAVLRARGSRRGAEGPAKEPTFPRSPTK
jgi:hypothetical protein